MNFYFILIETATSGNIGACARALKTMGFRFLRLVNPQCNPLNRNALWMAHGATDILEQVEIYASLDDAIKDLDFVISTTARKRTISKTYYSPEKVIELIKGKRDFFSNIGVIFGRESSGLTNDEILKSDIVTSITMSTSFPALNLSQAVMLYAYLFYTGLYNCSCKVIKDNDNQLCKHSFRILKDKINLLCDMLNLSYNNKMRVWLLDKLNFLDANELNYVFDIYNCLQHFINTKNFPIKQ